MLIVLSTVTAKIVEFVAMHDIMAYNVHYLHEVLGIEVLLLEKQTHSEYQTKTFALYTSVFNSFSINLKHFCGWNL